jgi:hypothetical protein
MKIILKSMFFLSLAVCFSIYGVQVVAADELLALAPMGEQAVPTPAPTPSPLMGDSTGTGDGMYGDGNSNGDDLMLSPMMPTMMPTPSPSPAAGVEYSLSQYTLEGENAFMPSPTPSLMADPPRTYCPNCPTHTPWPSPLRQRSRTRLHTPRPRSNGIMTTPSPMPTPMGDELSPLSLLIQNSGTTGDEKNKPPASEEEEQAQAQAQVPNQGSPADKPSTPDFVPYASPTPFPAEPGLFPEQLGDGNKNGNGDGNPNGSEYGNGYDDNMLYTTPRPMTSPTPTPFGLTY